jgi:hypothetical protein
MNRASTLHYYRRRPTLSQGNYIYQVDTIAYIRDLRQMIVLYLILLRSYRSFFAGRPTNLVFFDKQERHYVVPRLFNLESIYQSMKTTANRTAQPSVICETCRAPYWIKVDESRLLGWISYGYRTDPLHLVV